MSDGILRVIWFLLPSGAANMAPVFAEKLFPAWNTPIDGGILYGGQPLLGDHKTVRGLVAGLLISVAVFVWQQQAYENNSFFREISLFDYSQHSWPLGIFFGVGALGGDLVKSFLKRRKGKEPGASWFPFDQIDWMVGTLLVTAPLIPIDVNLILVSLVLAFVLSLIIKWIGYLIHLNKNPI